MKEGIKSRDWEPQREEREGAVELLYDGKNQTKTVHLLGRWEELGRFLRSMEKPRDQLNLMSFFLTLLEFANSLGGLSVNETLQVSQRERRRTRSKLERSFVPSETESSLCTKGHLIFFLCLHYYLIRDLS